MSKLVVVTGASRGIGRAIAASVKEQGFTPVLVGRSESSLASTNEAIDGLVCSLDVTATDAGARLGAFVRKHGDLWGLVNNAGMAESAPLANTSDDLMRRHFELNVEAPLRLTRDLLSLFDAGGRVVNMCSTAGLRGYPYVSAYVASKHALLGLTRALSIELVPKNITVNAVCPGYVRTEMFETTLKNIGEKTGLPRDDAEAKLAKLSPQKRVFEPTEVASVVSFLLSETSNGITGQAISIDGGEVQH